MLLCFIDILTRISIKIYFIIVHLDYFSDNYVDYSEEQGECFNQDILTIEDKYQGNVTIETIVNIVTS